MANNEFNKLQYFGNLAKAGVLQELRNASLKVLCSLYDHSNGDGSSSRPGLENLMEETGLKKTAVTDALRDLVEFGCISQTGKGGRSAATGARWASTFALHIPPTLDVDVALRVRRRNNPPKRQPQSPLPDGPVMDGGVDYRKTNSSLPENQMSTTGNQTVDYRNSDSPLPETRQSTTGLSGTYQTPYTKPPASNPSTTSAPHTNASAAPGGVCGNCGTEVDELILEWCRSCLNGDSEAEEGTEEAWQS